MEAKHHGAKIKSIEGFVRFILRRREKKSSAVKPEMQETDANIKRYLAAFEKSDGRSEDF